MGNFHFFGRGRANFGGGGMYIHEWLARVHPGAYISILDPSFGAKDKDVCYTPAIILKEKVGTKKAFLKVASLYILARRPKKSLFWTPLVARKMTPRSPKSGYGLLLGRKLALDRASGKKPFFCDVRTKIG